MQCALIPPRELLRVLDVGSLHYALAHEALRDEEYADYYRELSRQGEFVILDNGADELGEGISGETLLKLEQDLEPSELILPDVLEDKVETIRRGEEFLELSRDYDVKSSYMGVAQGKSFKEFIECFDHWYYHPDPRVTTVGIPYDLNFDDFEMDFPPLWGTKAITWAHRRVSMVKFLEKTGYFLGSTKSIHLLGTNDIFEFVLLRMLGLDKFIRSTDTTAPFASGLSSEHSLFSGAVIGVPCLRGDKDWPRLDFHHSPSQGQTMSSVVNLLAYTRAVGDTEAYCRTESISNSL